MKNRIISVILILASLFIFCVPASAARQEEYLSEIALVYALDLEDAKAQIAGLPALFSQQKQTNPIKKTLTGLAFISVFV